MLQMRAAILAITLCFIGYGQIVNSGGGGGGGGGTGTVTSVTVAGTANQITATGTCSGTTVINCTLSIPSGFVLPGTIDGLTITTTTGTLTIANGKTLTVSKTLTLDGTDGVTLTFPSTSATMARTDAGQTFTGSQTFSSTIVGSINGNAATATSIAANTGTTTTVLHGNAAGTPAFSAVVSADLNITTTTCTAPQMVTALSGGAVGTCTAPTVTQNSKSADYTTVLGDAGKQIYHPSADTTTRTWTIDANATVAYPIGTVITFVNDTSAGAITIAITSDTMILAGAGTTGSRTLAASGIATALKITSTRWIINGTGLT